MVDINDIHDPNEKLSTLDQITNFGITPRQLFQKPHPKKNLEYIREKLKKNLKYNIFKVNDLHNLQLKSMKNKKSIKNIKNIYLSNGKILPLNSKSLFFNCNYNYNDYYYYYKRSNPNNNHTNININNLYNINKANNNRNGIHLNNRNNSINSNIILSWNFNDNSLRIISNEKEYKTLFKINNPHNGKISIASLSENSKNLITYGKDTIMKLWHVNWNANLEYPRISLHHSFFTNNKSITSITVSSNFGILIAGFKDGSCYLYDLNRKIFLKKLQKLSNPIILIKISSLTGEFLISDGSNLLLFTLNGKFLSKLNIFDHNLSKITCTEIIYYQHSFEDELYLTGHQNGDLIFWSIKNNQYTFNKSMGGNRIGEKGQLTNNQEKEKDMNLKFENKSKFNLILKKNIKRSKITCLNQLLIVNIYI
ncbi:beige/beach-related [Anaeramoeba flamelloides]|uniref:Beige/beach-related n=1 Tax=Anaeramoeba flamelloides TaxID=1746091 RepID=A0ABQ8YKI0_9EUKA|nr:beige/beach-related [Anaeramoeba flamelloides]